MSVGAFSLLMMDVRGLSPAEGGATPGQMDGPGLHKEAEQSSQ